MIHFRVLTAVACAAQFVLGVPPAGAADPPGAGRRCGEFCLRVALPGLDFPTGAADAALESLGVAPAAGHALADLTAAVEAAGGHARAVRTTASNLQTRRDAGERFACVAHLDGDHYALLAEFADDGRTRVLDPPRAYWLPPETLAGRWDGTALLVSRSPLRAEENLPGPTPWAWVLVGASVLLALAGGLLWRRTARRSAAAGATTAALLLGGGFAGCAPERGTGPVTATDAARPAPPRAVFETVRRDAGAVPILSGPRELEFPVINRGGSPLRFLSLDASCGCTDVAGPAELAPGQSGIIRARIDPRIPENRRSSIVVTTNAPGASQTLLELRWRAVAPWTPEPAELDFGVLRPGEVAERTVRLTRHKVAGPTAGRPIEVLPPTDESGRPSASLVADWATPPAAGEPAVRVRLTSPDEEGTGGGMALVRMEGAWLDQLAVPVRWEVRDVAAVRPPRFTFGAGPAGAPRTVRVTLVGTGPLEIDGPPEFVWSTENGTRVNTVCSVTVQRLTPERVMLELTGPLPAAPGVRAGTLTMTVAVETNSGMVRRDLTVPGSAVVAASAGEGGAS